MSLPVDTPATTPNAADSVRVSFGKLSLTYNTFVPGSQGHQVASFQESPLASEHEDFGGIEPVLSRRLTPEDARLLKLPDVQRKETSAYAKMVETTETLQVTEQGTPEKVVHKKSPEISPKKPEDEISALVHPSFKTSLSAGLDFFLPLFRKAFMLGWKGVFAGCFDDFKVSKEKTGHNYLLLYMLCNPNLDCPLHDIGSVTINTSNPYVVSLMDGLELKYWDIALLVYAQRMLCNYYSKLEHDELWSFETLHELIRYKTAGLTIMGVRHIISHPLGPTGTMSNDTYTYCSRELKRALKEIRVDDEEFLTQSGLLSTVKTADIQHFNRRLKELESLKSQLELKVSSAEASYKAKITEATVARNKAEEQKNICKKEMAELKKELVQLQQQLSAKEAERKQAAQKQTQAEKKLQDLQKLPGPSTRSSQRK